MSLAKLADIPLLVLSIILIQTDFLSLFWKSKFSSLRVLMIEFLMLIMLYSVTDF